MVFISILKAFHERKKARQQELTCQIFEHFRAGEHLVGFGRFDRTLSKERRMKIGLGLVLITFSGSMALAQEPALNSKGLRCAILFAAEETATKKVRVIPTETSELQAQYKSVERQLTWSQWVDNNTEFLRFIHAESALGARKSGKHASETYGLKAYLEYRRAEDFVNSIPVGKLNLTPELIAEIHRHVWASVAKPVEKALDPVLPDGLLLDKGGVFKIRNNYGADPIRHPLTEAQYQALKSNTWIDRFIELPWPFSRENRRRGIIVYGAAKDVHTKLGQLIDWYNSNRGKVDPIELAALFQYRFVSIHPFVNGNGRTSTILMNRILREFGLPPMLRNEVMFDIYFTEKEWVEATRQGVREYLRVAIEAAAQDGEIPAVYRTNFADSARTSLFPESARARAKQAEIDKVEAAFAERLSFMTRKLFPSRDEAEILIGGQKFLFAYDGFFYSNRGIPHVLHEGRLHPVADRTYFLYAENGPLVSKRFSRRGLTTQHRDVYRAHFRFMKDVAAKKIDPTEITVLTYDQTVRDANTNGQMHLFDFQKPLFENAIRIRDREPMAILATTRGAQTNFERSFDLNSKVSAAEVLAQYQIADLKFYEYLDFAQTQGRSDWIHEIQASRRLLFDAAKQLLRQVDVELQNQPDQVRQALLQDPRWKLFEKYLSHSPLKYESFDQYLKLADDTQMVIIRSDHSIPEVIGFRSNQNYIDLAKKLPGYEAFKSWILEAAEDIKKKQQSQNRWVHILRTKVPKFEALAPKIARVLATHRFDSRGTEVEFDRVFVDHYLHSINSPLKTGVSFSTSTDLYIRKSTDEDSATSTNKLPFTIEGMTNSVYFVRVPKTHVAFNMASKYFRQFEVLTLKPISGRRIVEELEAPFFQSTSTSGLDPAAKEQVQEFWDKGFFVNRRN